MTPLIIYHDNCADGFGAAWAAYRKFEADGAEYLPMNYNDPRVSVEAGVLKFPVSVHGRDVYILDFSFSPAVHEAIRLLANRLFWRDHHKTAFEALGLDPLQIFAATEENEDVILDPNKSGCVLAWELFHPGTPTPRILELIQDRDLWRWELPGTRAFATALRSEPFTFDNFDLAACNVGELTRTGEAMNHLFDQQLEDITKRPVPTRLHADGVSWFGLSVNCTPQFASEAGNALAKLSGNFGLTWYAGEVGQVFVSLRSIGDYDVSDIAKQFGGGGHKNAAGFKTTLHQLRFNDAGRLEILAEPRSDHAELYGFVRLHGLAGGDGLEFLEAAAVEVFGPDGGADGSPEQFDQVVRLAKQRYEQRRVPPCQGHAAEQERES